MITPEDSYLADRLIARFCDHCPVVVECGTLALASPAYLVGIWGGVFLPQVYGNPRVRKARREGLAALKQVCDIVGASETA